MDQGMEMHWYIKVWMRTLEEPVVFEVTKEDMERFERIYGSGQDGFFVCPTREGTHIAINLKHVEAANLLWDAGVHEKEKTEDGGNWIVLHVHGRKAIWSDVGDPADIAYILSALELSDSEQREVLAFTDSDGELMMFDPGSLVYIEVPTSVVEEGQRELEGELEEGKRPRSRASAVGTSPAHADSGDGGSPARHGG